MSAVRRAGSSYGLPIPAEEARKQSDELLELKQRHDQMDEEAQAMIAEAKEKTNGLPA